MRFAANAAGNVCIIVMAAAVTPIQGDAVAGIRLGRILGVEVRIDYSWFLIFFLILWSLTLGAFPASYPGQSSGVYLAMGVAGTLLFCASILAHELSHSVVARRRGIPVEGITLFIFGGMAHTRMEAERPGDEFVIAGVGPLSSLLLGVAFAATGWLARAAGWSPAVAAVAGYLAFINVALALFNLLPGFPLDGGRIFRAAVWKRTGDLMRATRYATTGGKWIGLLLIAWGVLQMFVFGGLGGLWLVFIGWFVRSAADASFTQHVMLRSLEGVRARDVMTPQPQSVMADMSVQEFVDAHVLHGRHRAFPVVENGRAIGLIAVEQVKTVPREEWAQRQVRDAMVTLDDIAVAEPHDKMTDVLRKFAGAPAGRVLIVQHGHVDGVITRGDLARWLERSELADHTTTR